MPQSLAQIVVHTVFSTKDRYPFLRDRALRDELHHYLGGILIHLDCQPLVIGGVEDHVHLLSRMSRVSAPAKLVREVKRSSTLWLKTKDPAMRDFAWQSGYAMFSLGYSQIDSVRDYISRQEEHHQKTSFQDELRQFLKKYQVAYDERHVWD